MRHAAMFLAIVSVIGTACGGAAAPGGSPTAPAATASAPSSSAAQTPEDVDIDVCALMPLGDVEALSPFITPLVTADSDSLSSGQCRYDASIDSKTVRPSIILAVDSGSFVDYAVPRFHQAEQDCIDSGLTPVAIAGLGDEAFGCGAGDASVEAVVGSRFFVHAHLKGEWDTGWVPDVGTSENFAAGTALLQLLITRLP